MGPEWGWPQVGQMPDSVTASGPLTVYNQTPCLPAPKPVFARPLAFSSAQCSTAWPLRLSLSPPTPHRSAPDIYPWTEPRPASCPSPLQVAVPQDPPPPIRSAWKVWPALEALCHKHRSWGWPERACSPPTAQTQKLRKTAAGGGRQGCGDAAAVGPRGFSWCRGRNPDTEDSSITYLEDRQGGGVSWAPSSGWNHLSDVSPPPAPRAGPDQLWLPGLTP